MEHKNAYEHITQNNLKTAFLVMLFPVTLLALLYGALWLVFVGEPEGDRMIKESLAQVGFPVIAVAAVWTLIAYLCGDKMMLGFAGAELLPDTKEYRKVYHAVENIALAAGLPTPKVYVIEDDSLNAFATGHSPKSASVALTRGIINKLEPLELEAVIAHEMAHIGNRDIRLDLIMITGIGVSTILADILLRSSGRRSGGKKDSGALLLMIGLAMLIFSWIVAPLLRLAVSRTREYAADATAAVITRNPAALASALQKISADPRVEVIDEKPSMAQAFIFSPEDAQKSFSALGSTHPPVADRIHRLNEMG